MKDFLLILLYLAVVAAKLCRHGGVRSMMAENLVLRQQLIVLRRGRRRAPSLTWSDRLICGFGSLFLSAGRIQAVVELKSRNPRFGCPRIARIISQTFGIDIDRNVVYRVLSKHYRHAPGGAACAVFS